MKSDADSPADDAGAITSFRADAGEGTRFRILGALSLSHFLNDMMQSLMLALYPVLKGEFALTFAQVGLITLMFQFTASLMQPLVGIFTDRRPQTHALSAGMGFTFLGLATLAIAPSYEYVLLAAALIGTGSAVFHPESARIAHLASGGRHGLAQSVFQVGGYAGQAAGPLIAAWLVIPFGRSSVGAFCAMALLAIGILWSVGSWYRAHRLAAPRRSNAAMNLGNGLPQRTIIVAITVLILLVVSKSFYLTSLNTFLTLYLIEKFSISVTSAQMYLFALLASVAVGTILGGLVIDRVGRKAVIWFSILGAAPFALALPYAGLELSGVLIVLIGTIIAAASPALLVYAQEILPNRIGLVSGLFFGLAFGIGGLGAAALGKVADITDINFVYKVCAWIPLAGLLAALLPSIDKRTV